MDMILKTICVIWKYTSIGRENGNGFLFPVRSRQIALGSNNMLLVGVIDLMLKEAKSSLKASESFRAVRKLFWMERMRTLILGFS